MAYIENFRGKKIVLHPWLYYSLALMERAHEISTNKKEFL